LEHLIIGIAVFLFTCSAASARVFTTIFQQETSTDKMIPFTAEVYSTEEPGMYNLYMGINSKCSIRGHPYHPAPIENKLYVHCSSGYPNWMMTEEAPHRILVNSEIGQKFYAKQGSLYYNLFYALKTDSDTVSSNLAKKSNANPVIYQDDEVVLRAPSKYNNFSLTYKSEDCNVQYTPMYKIIIVTCPTEDYYTINEEGGTIRRIKGGEPPMKLVNTDSGYKLYSTVSKYKAISPSKKISKKRKGTKL
jgi:hypothetical protein